MSFATRTWAGGTWADGPEAASGEYTISGAVSFPVAVSASMLEGRALAGAVSFPLAVSATMLEGRVLAGATSYPLDVSAAMEYTAGSGAYEIAGAVSYPLDVSATMLEGRALAGAVAYALDVGSAMAYTPFAVPDVSPQLPGSGGPMATEAYASKRKRRRPPELTVVLPSADEQDLRDVEDILALLGLAA